MLHHCFFVTVMMLNIVVGFRSVAMRRTAFPAMLTSNYMASTTPTAVAHSDADSPAAVLKNFYTVSETEFADTMKSWGQPTFRTKQVRSWVYEKGVIEFSEMLDLPVPLRTKLKEHYAVGDLRLSFEQVSKDGTRKRAYKLHDGQLIESVLMPYEDGRRTACISSQAGCAMGCVFCATGQMGFFRQLTSAEIFEQVQRFSAELRKDGQRLSNVVMMGMGEPLANYENVMTAIRRMNTELGIGARHITISTVGLAPRIRKLAEDPLQVGLAVSLHQATDAKRDALMPVNKRYPIPELMDACRYYVATTNRRISFEWALIRGETDTPETAQELGQLLRGLHCHVNVIPLNPTSGFGGKPTPKAGVDEFIRILGEFGVPCTPRTRRGIDIDAGCGQLKAELLKRQRPSRVGVDGVEGVGEVEGGVEGEEEGQGEDEEGEGEGEETAFVSLDVAAERQHVFDDIEAAGAAGSKGSEGAK
jgi:23S rRNA (adenine2503-C2)-methyltransferase